MVLARFGGGVCASVGTGLWCPVQHWGRSWWRVGGGMVLRALKSPFLLFVVQRFGGGVVVAGCGRGGQLGHALVLGWAGALDALAACDMVYCCVWRSVVMVVRVLFVPAYACIRLEWCGPRLELTWVGIGTHVKAHLRNEQNQKHTYTLCHNQDRNARRKNLTPEQML